MEGNEMRGLTPYESFMVAEKTSRRPSGAAITGLVIAGVSAVAAIGAWIFAPTYANARVRGAERASDIYALSTNNTLNRLATLLDQERGERVAQGVTMSQSITDSISGQQQGSQSQSTSVENQAVASATQQLLTQAMLGNLSENAQKVQIYSAPAPCGCPGSCNG